MLTGKVYVDWDGDLSVSGAAIGEKCTPAWSEDVLICTPLCKLGCC